MEVKETKHQWLAAVLMTKVTSTLEAATVKSTGGKVSQECSKKVLKLMTAVSFAQSSGSTTSFTQEERMVTLSSLKLLEATSR